jgi:hypothetical protein
MVYVARANRRGSGRNTGCEGGRSIRSVTVGAAAFVLMLGATSCEKATGPAIPGPAAKLIFTAQPGNAPAGAVLTPAVLVTVQDAHGNTATSATASITLSITPGTGTAGAHLRGTATVSAASGVATFSSLGIDSAGAGYTLTASAAGLTSDTSAAFDVAAAPGVQTGIKDIRAFLESCPTTDTAIARIRQDFVLLLDGQPVTAAIGCTEPYSALPIAGLTDELIALQVLRTAYYMSQGTEGKLPWTPLGLWAWMTSRVSGVNLKTAPGQLYCCDAINGKIYLSVSRRDSLTRDLSRSWPGIAITLDYYAHEIRHADPGSPGHTTGCQAFPQPTDPAGCDATYDLGNLGSYGVQYWLESNWATGLVNIGIGCSSIDTALAYATWNAENANGFRTRFVTDVPPTVAPTAPYGGACLSL